MRAAIAERAAAHGLRIDAAGTHPLARGADQAIVPRPRYERSWRSRSAHAVSAQLVCGLHVHVSVPDEDTALRAFEGVVPWLPTLLALSANSPFAEGADTGLRSRACAAAPAPADRRDTARPPRLGTGAGDGRRRRAPSLGTRGRGPSTGRSRCA